MLLKLYLTFHRVTEEELAFTGQGAEGTMLKERKYEQKKPQNHRLCNLTAGDFLPRYIL